MFVCLCDMELAVLVCFRFLTLMMMMGGALSEGNEVSLRNEEDFLKFVEDVNSGTSFTGTTIFLDALLDLANYTTVCNPIGKDPSTPFSGTFDGQGYAINSFVVNTTARYAGLFGYASGAIIKNTIVSMKSVISVSPNDDDRTSDALYVGGIIGCCRRSIEYCKIESSVNLANVAFTGKANGIVYVGGIAGYISSEDESHIRNCANYGVVNVTGESKSIYLGGIIGNYDSSENNLVISNCLNLPPIIFNPASISTHYVGGIAGRSRHCSFDSCVSNGVIRAVKSETIGSLCGSHEKSTFKNCFWSKESGTVVAGTELEDCASYNSSFILDRTVSAGNYTGDRLLTALNSAADYYSMYEYSHWGYSVGKHNVDFIVNGRMKHFNPDNYLLLFPGLSSDGSLSFDGWYTDKEYTIPVTNFVIEKDVEMYGKWGKNTNLYTVTFDARGGTLSTPELTGYINTNIVLPKDVKKPNCMFRWWENDYGDSLGWDYTVMPYNITLRAVWCCEEIRTASDLAGLAKVVNSGISYKGTTVSLANDIEFSEEESRQFEFIGKASEANFDGTFDGRGYAIKNLDLRLRSSKYGGIFGYSKGMKLRNVVVDSTSSVVITYGSDDKSFENSFFGSLVGSCDSLNGGCAIENSVNMASVTFTGSADSNIYIGGLAGYIDSYQSYVSSVVNCVNYGTVAQAGKANSYSAVGGLLGGSTGVLIANCVNYGTLRHDGVSKNPCIGGIVEYNKQKAEIINCVNFGEIISNDPGSLVGAIAGEISIESSVENCYWDTSTPYEPYGSLDSSGKIESLFGFSTETFELTGPASVGTYTGDSLIEALNAYSEMNYDKNYSHWALNKNRSSVRFVIDNRTVPFLSVNSQVVLIPNITGSERKSFWGWFVYSNYTEYFRSTEITEDITLYGFIGETYAPPRKSGTKLIWTVFLYLIISILFLFLIFSAIIILVMLKKNKDNLERDAELDAPLINERIDSDNYSRLVAVSSGEVDSPVVAENTKSVLYNLYPHDYVEPTVKEALAKTGLADELVELIFSACENSARHVMEEYTVPDGFTETDAIAIAMYTYDFGRRCFENNPYRIINSSIVNRDFAGLQRASGILYLVMKALRKLPRVTGRTLYRGVKSGVNLDEDYYREGNIITWPALSSTSPNMKATKAFLAKGSATKKATGTLFIIEGGWGYDIQPFSLFPTESEILLEPERQFKITGVIDSELTVINLQMLNTPLSIPGVFGDGNSSK